MTLDGEAGGNDLMDTRTRRNRWYQIPMTFARYHWRCNEFRGNFEADTIEAHDWTAGTPYVDDNRVPKCDPRYQAEIGPDRYFQRQKGSGTQYQAGFSVGGFSGSTSVATANNVSQKWSNDSDRTRRLCGATDYPSRFTLVRTEA
jgi:hypothetical protein